ncbi:flagellar biosynthetic protein FliR [Lachnotalea glycerini]|jgi:flagellar biosynthesis protein FliR|uniref:Flagellar biosynthetic protein FliR n=1 Tax=Lachnotalea glycerini TaxID=1763509 RepID=A0A318EPW5_9FIRM|nr:flagellar biosynthetic protein FliR [Lachnotalea glycerini]PXV93521.1 flagellar biosynthetic protein FliR [Lachnotalea glycerini]
MVNMQFTQGNLEQLLLIFIRISAFIFIAPYYSINNVPRRLRAGLAFFITLVLYPVLPKGALAYSTVIEYAVLVVKESIAGLLIGLSANICYSIIAFAGRIIDMDIGFAMVSVLDPVSKEQTSITGTFYNYLFMLIMVCSDMPHYLLRAIVDAYQLIPLGNVQFNMNSLYSSFLMYLGDYLIIGFRIVLPIFAVILVTNIILGVLAKVAPQMNMFVIGMQLKILMGLITIFITIGMFNNVSNYIFTEMKKMIVSMIQGMY